MREGRSADWLPNDPHYFRPSLTSERRAPTKHGLVVS
jgi:hypothetical protein